MDEQHWMEKPAVTSLAEMHDGMCWLWCSCSGSAAGYQDTEAVCGCMCSSQAQAVEAARVKAEQACRLAMMVAQRADTMLTTVGLHHEASMVGLHTTESTRLQSGDMAEGDDRWDEDSVFPDAFSGIMDDMPDSRTNTDEAFSDMGVGHGRTSLSGESSAESVPRARCHGRMSSGLTSPAALVQRLSSAGCRSPEEQAGVVSGADVGSKATICQGDENSPLLGNVQRQVAAVEGKRRAFSVPRLLLGEPRSA
eukprot:jgi/Ulvmu1/175/UM001_0179.1